MAKSKDINTSDGWIKIHRDIRDSWIWQDPVKLKWWIDLLLMVNHEDNEVLIGNQLVTCKRGETITSLSRLSERWNVSRDTVRHFLNLCAKCAQITHKTHTNYTQITICNYDTYQDTAHNIRHKTDTKSTQNRHKQEYIIINNNIIERKNIFYASLSHFKNQYPEELIKEFYDYWTELTPTGKKMRFELQKVFEPSRRLSTWKKNNEKWQKPLSPDKPIIGQTTQSSLIDPNQIA